MARMRLGWASVVFFVAGLASALWAVFLVGQGLEKADQWSSVAAFGATVVFGVLSVLIARRSRHPAQERSSPGTPNDGTLPPPGNQTINVHGGIAPIVGPGGTQTNNFNTTPPGT
ncbi:hypothetical protein ACIBO1_30830 [Micromonospora sp. NPDC049903]|uniref:hypothetical protein n=1 Tax=Micromonospora sp. NPDC049903 TaxID=3364276 RepID=UPI0037B85F48